jgi:hypothetical protein
MKIDGLNPVAHKAAGNGRKPRHIAEKLESYLGIGIAVVGMVLLGVMLVGFAQTGSGTPSWMQ